MSRIYRIASVVVLYLYLSVANWTRSAPGHPASVERAVSTVTMHGQGAVGGILYRPGLLDQYVGYPRVIRLAHDGAANGTLVASFDVFGNNRDSQVVYRSTNGGRSWSHAATVSDDAYAGRSCCATLYELPRTWGARRAGTLLLAASEGAAGTMGHEIKVFRSSNAGGAWRYLSSCARGAGGVWEPEFAVDRSGRLVCYFSDERLPQYSQFLGHVVSTDGGRTWGAEKADVAVPDGTARPGMATVVRLPDGRYVMSFEVCGRTNCEVHLKTSPNGDDWGAASDLGSLVQTTDGRYAGHTPYVTWTPAGEPHGELVLTSQDLFGRDNTVTSDSRRVVLVNRRDGVGPWSVIPAPVATPPDPPGSQPSCGNYSSALLPSPAGDSLFMLAGSLLPNGECEIRYGFSKLT